MATRNKSLLLFFSPFYPRKQQQQKKAVQGILESPTQQDVFGEHNYQELIIITLFNV